MSLLGNPKIEEDRLDKSIVTDKRVLETLEEVLIELKIMNKYNSKKINETLTIEDIEDV